MSSSLPSELVIQSLSMMFADPFDVRFQAPLLLSRLSKSFRALLLENSLIVGPVHIQHRWDVDSIKKTFSRAAPANLPFSISYGQLCVLALQVSHLLP